MRVGIGFDAHRFAPGRPCVLGGVEIPHPLGLLGHSDADVLTHAIMDALLGAAALGDIGQHFPDSDERWRNASSIALLRRVAQRLAENGWRAANVDASVQAEAPRLAPHNAAMRRNIADALALDSSAVSVKATTMEGMGAVGRNEGMTAMAVATILKT
ncbi:MAG: 2-C-methyl-D-erythritol 2,4-cyclodiphosphate synthase [Kiritimatiellaeota bacterium]|nr:2-C-methyl-D-erythritol 2,4-cyclodiphosphate synthase [Kiritimatiellota bacterium]